MRKRPTDLDYRLVWLAEHDHAELIAVLVSAVPPESLLEAFAVIKSTPGGVRAPSAP